jgi:hypothetical protein
LVTEAGGLRGGKPRQRMDSPLIFKYSFIKISLSNANDAPLQLDRGLNGTVGGAASISFLQGTRA